MAATASFLYYLLSSYPASCRTCRLVARVSRLASAGTEGNGAAWGTPGHRRAVETDEADTMRPGEAAVGSAPALCALPARPLVAAGSVILAVPAMPAVPAGPAVFPVSVVFALFAVFVVFAVFAVLVIFVALAFAQAAVFAVFAVSVVSAVSAVLAQAAIIAMVEAIAAGQRKFQGRHRPMSTPLEFRYKRGLLDYHVCSDHGQKDGNGLKLCCKSKCHSIKVDR